MEKMKVVGYREVDFEDKESGKRIQGVSLYVNHTADDVHGEMAEKLFLRPDVMMDNQYSPVVGEVIGITWGRKNRIVSIEKVK